MRHMNGLIRGALALALAATASMAQAGPHGPPLAGAREDEAPNATPAYRDDMPGPDRQAGPRGGYDPYGFDRRGITQDGYDLRGYDAQGYDRYGFDPAGYTRDGYDRFGYDERGLDRYGRRAPTRYGQVAPAPAPHGYAERERGDDRYADPGPGPDRYGPPPAIYDRDDRAYAERRADSYAPGPRDYWDEPADGYYVPSFGGALQHYADPRCSTCRPAVRRPPCGCETSYSTGAVSVNPGFFYETGGVGPIPDGGYYGGGGYVVMGGGASAHSSASAYASSSSRVSVRVGGGHGGSHGGGHGGCNSCGGHK